MAEGARCQGIAKKRAIEPTNTRPHKQQQKNPQTFLPFTTGMYIFDRAPLSSTLHELHFLLGFDTVFCLLNSSGLFRCIRQNVTTTPPTVPLCIPSQCSQFGSSGEAMSRRVPPAEKQLEKAAEHIQSNLKTAVHTAELDALASYFTLTEPHVRGVPFCVALSRATFLFHLQMERVLESDVDVYVELIGKVCALISAPRHPFADVVLRTDVFGIAGASGHAVVLLPVQQYAAMAHLASELVIREAVPADISAVWRHRLEQYSAVRSPLVSLRSQLLAVKTSELNNNPEDLSELQRVIQTRPTRMNVDLLLLCYERLQRLVPDASQGGAHGRALSILSSDIFLKLRSPIRKHYVEHYLYPSLASPDTSHFLDNEGTRRHMSTLLLRQCTPGMQPGSPYYMCLCAIIQRDLVEELNGAMELVSLMEYQMPHAAYFISALAMDVHMAQGVLIKMLMLLNRGAAHVMAQRDPLGDPIAAVVNNRTTMVYNILFCLRAIARQCVATDSKRASELQAELRAAVSPATVQALGSFAAQAFEGRCDISIEPQLLCAELGMFLHDSGVDDAIEACVEHFKTASSTCHHCGGPRYTTLVCHVTGGAHLSDRSAMARVLSTVSDCSGGQAVQSKLVSLLRSRETNMLPATHYLVHHIVFNAGQHRAHLLSGLEPHIRSLLVMVSDADADNSIPSDSRASVLVLHARLVGLFPQDPLQLQSMLKIVLGLTIRCEHDGLSMFWLGHKLLRIGKANVELLALDPVETHYGQDVPGTAPSSYAAADNAQLLLKILLRVHSYSEAMRRLVGCSVCRLIQDFNVQSPNIVSSLLDPIGLLPNTGSSASSYGFPCVPESVFWNFVIRQMKRSAPARTAFVIAATRCVSTRFRHESPTVAVTTRHEDPSSHLFAIGFFTSLRRNAQMARIVSYMLAGWIGMRGHKPGKFVCLLYMCCQLARALVSGINDDLCPTEAERSLFNAALQECTEAVRSAIPEARLLASAVADNPSFCWLLERVICASCDVAGEPSAEAVSAVAPDDDVFAEDDFDDGAIGSLADYDSLSVPVEGAFVSEGDNCDELGGFDMASSSAAPSSTAPTCAQDSLPATLDTVVGSDADHSVLSLGARVANIHPVNAKTTLVRDGLSVASRPPVEMPFPISAANTVAVRDGASQTSPNGPFRSEAPALPVLQAHAAASYVPSDVVFDYLMSHQSRVSTLEDLRQLQFADASAYAPQSEALSIAVGVREENSYSEPHGEQRTGEALGFVTSQLVSFAASTPASTSGLKRAREAVHITPHQPVGSPWVQGIDSARNELRSVMDELGMGRGPRSGDRVSTAEVPAAHTAYPTSFEHHQQMMRGLSAQASLPHALVDQHSETALREVRQAMGAANPNTAHTLSGRARKEPLASNATYNIGSSNGGAFSFL